MSGQSLEQLYQNSRAMQEGMNAPLPNPEIGNEPIQPPVESHSSPEQGETGLPAQPQPPVEGAPPAPIDELPRDVAGMQEALKAERRKRQEYEQKFSEHEHLLAELRQQVAYTQQQHGQHGQQEPEVPDPLIDPEGAFRHQQQVFEKALQEQQATLQQQMFETRVLTSQQQMRSQHADYDEMEEIFAQAMEHNPALEAQLLQHPFPAEFAYTQGKNLKIQRETGGDLDAFVQKKVAEALAQHQQQQPMPQPQVPTVPTDQRPTPPQSLARAPSSAPRAEPVNTGPVSLAAIYKNVHHRG
jgi:hypothetical protein